MMARKRWAGLAVAALGIEPRRRSLEDLGSGAVEGAAAPAIVQ